MKHGVWGPESRTGTETDTCTACAGTIILEFAALSRYTGDPVFEVSAFFFSHIMRWCAMNGHLLLCKNSNIKIRIVTVTFFSHAGPSPTRHGLSVGEEAEKQ